MEKDLLLFMAEYIDPALIVLVPLLWGIGAWLKDIPKIQNWTIPFYLMLVSVVLATSYMGITQPADPIAYWMGIVQGLVIAVVQGYSYNIVTQLKRRG